MALETDSNRRACQCPKIRPSLRLVSCNRRSSAYATTACVSTTTRSAIHIISTLCLPTCNRTPIQGPELEEEGRAVAQCLRPERRCCPAQAMSAPRASCTSSHAPPPPPPPSRVQSWQGCCPVLDFRILVLLSPCWGISDALVKALQHLTLPVLPTCSPPLPTLPTPLTIAPPHPARPDVSASHTHPQPT